MFKTGTIRRLTSKNKHSTRLLVALSAVLALTACSPSTDDMLASARNYISENDIAAASIQLKSLLQQDGTVAEARFLLGSISLAEGDVAGAVRELRRAQELGYPRKDVLPILAQAMIFNGDFDRIVKDFADVQFDDPLLQAVMLTRVGEAHLARGEGVEAQGVFVTALGLNPDEVLAEVGLARSYLLLEDLDAAMSVADSALSRDPDLADAYAVRADVFRLRGDGEAFVREIQHALKAQPKGENYHFSLIGALINLEQYEEAEAALSVMREAVGDRPAAHYLQAFIDFRLGRFPEAGEAIERALNQAPGYLPANLLAGSIYLQLNDHVRVRHHMERVLGLEPGEGVARRVLATSHMAVGNILLARNVLGPLLDGPGVTPYDLGLAGQIHLALGDFEKASAFFARVRDLEPEDLRSRAGKGLSLLALGRTEEGLSELQAAASLDAVGLHDSMLIMAYIREERFDDALQAHRQLAAKQPDAPQVDLLLGGIYLATGDHVAAREAFQKAQERNPAMLSAVVNLARLDVAEGKPGQARARLDALTALDVTRVEPYLLMADLLRDTGASPDEVLAVIERAVASAPQSRAARIAQASQLAAMGRMQQALAIAQELVAAEDNDVEAITLLARIQSSMGDVQQAIANLNRVVGLQPFSAEPLAVIANLQRLQLDTAGAEQSLKRALELRPDATALQQSLITLLIEQQRLREAIDVARNVQRQLPHSFVGYAMHGDILAMEGNQADAINSYRDAIDRGAGADVAARLHNLLVRAERQVEASSLVEKWLAQNPQDVLFRTYLTELVVASGDLESAERAYREMLEIEPENPMLLNNLASVAGRLGRQDALPLALMAFKQAPDNPAVLDTVGTLQIRAGETEQGLANLKHAVVLAPHLPVLRLNLAKAYLDLGQRADAERELDEVLNQAPEGSPLVVEAQRLLEAD